MRKGLVAPTLISLAVLLLPVVAPAEEVAVRYPEGTVRGFLVLRTLDGRQIATGDLSQVVRGDRLTAHLVNRFKDGSLDEDTAVFSQRRTFRLISDHHVQRGPSFPHPTDVSIKVQSGQVTVRSIEDGKEKVTTEHLDLPTDLANGVILTLMKNVRPDAPETKVSLLVATPKLRLVHLAISPRGEEPFSVAGARHKAMHFVVKVELGGVAGVVAPIIGKQPHDTGVWMLGGTAPAFVKSEGPAYEGGPVWRTELASPVWPGPQRNPDR